MFIKERMLIMKYLKIGFAFLVMINFISARNLPAQPLQGHIVSVQEVQDRINSQSSQRTENIQEIQKLLRHSEMQKHAGNLFDLRKIEAATANLDDRTLEELAGQSRIVNDQLQAGAKNPAIVAIVFIAFIIAITVYVATGLK